jgi:hypothetical protein
MPCERKSVEPMAAVTASARTAAQHRYTEEQIAFALRATLSLQRVLMTWR